MDDKSVKNGDKHTIEKYYHKTVSLKSILKTTDKKEIDIDKPIQRNSVPWSDEI